MYQAYNNNLIVKKVNDENINGIFMPSNDDNSFLVVSIGNNVDINLLNKHIIVSKYIKEFTDNNDTYFIVSIEDVLAVKEK